MSNSKNFFHSTLVVSNIKNHISVVLETKNIQYGTWAELFKIHAQSHKFIHHIIPSKKGKEKKPPETDVEQQLWSTLNATVL